MNSKRGWRKGFGFAQIMAMIVVVIPVTIFIITLLFDYWTLMQLDNRLKLMSHRAITAINNSSQLSPFSLPTADQSAIESLCPSSKPTLSLSRLGDMAMGQTKVVSVVTYDKFNHLGTKELNATIVSYSYNDQNGSFKLECN